jgi:hypothetical protein
LSAGESGGDVEHRIAQRLRLGPREIPVQQQVLWLGTAESEQVLRRFTCGGPKHPTYTALEALGRRCAPSSPVTTSPTRAAPRGPRRRSFGTSGRHVVAHVLEPLRVPESSTWFTDCLPTYFVKSGPGSQGERLQTVYQPAGAADQTTGAGDNLVDGLSSRSAPSLSRGRRGSRSQTSRYAIHDDTAGGVLTCGRGANVEHGIVPSLLGGP